MVEQTITPQDLAQILERGERTSETRDQTNAFLQEVAAILADEIGPMAKDVGTRAHSDARKIQFIDRAYFYLAPDLEGTYFPMLTVYLFPGQLWWGLHAWGKESFARSVSEALQALDLASADDIQVGTGAFHADSAWGGGGYVSAGRQLGPDGVAAYDDLTVLAQGVAGGLADWWRRLQPHLETLREQLGFPEETSAPGFPGSIDIVDRLQQWREEVTNPEHSNHFHANLDWPAEHYPAIMQLVEKLRENPSSFTREDVVELFDHLNSGTRMKNLVADNNALPQLRKHLLELLDGEGEPAERIQAAVRAISYAGENILGELYGWVHAQEAPLANQCATNALSYLGYDFDPNNYNSFVAAHEQFKQVYRQQVGRLRPDLPLNLEVDKFYNVLDKVDIKDDHSEPKTPSRPLAAPFDGMFADYDEARWVMGFIAETARKVGFEAHPDKRFVLTMREGLLRLNFGNWMLVDYSATRKEFDVALVVDAVPEKYNFSTWGNFANSERDAAVHKIPVDLIKEFPEDLQKAYSESMRYIADRFSNWKGSPFHYAHQEIIFEALFDEDKRNEILTLGLYEPSMPVEETRYWRITLPTDWVTTLPDGSDGIHNVWETCLRHGIAAIGFDGDKENQQVQKFMGIKPDDRIVAFLRNKTIGGVGRVTSGYDDTLFEHHPATSDYFHGRLWFRIGVDWQPHAMDVDSLPEAVGNKFGRQTVLELSKEEFEIVVGIMEERYGERDFLAETHLLEQTMIEMLDMLLAKQQFILYGPPGTGKTYVAQHLAKLLTGLARPPSQRLEIVQFHPAYGYEDFIEGIRPRSKPAGDGHFMVDYPVEPGAFQRFCKVAQEVDGPCVFIIDEINRGNIPRIFGELMLLLEYRDQHVTLPYSGKPFFIPDNVYIIGTMNTADRSIALVDFALRRRFHFFRFDADPELFERWAQRQPGLLERLPYLPELYRQLSREAIDDPNYAIGPSYFMDPNLTETKLERIWRRSIVPYLEEYYFEQEASVTPWRWDSREMRAIRIREHPEFE